MKRFIGALLFCFLTALSSGCGAPPAPGEQIQGTSLEDRGYSLDFSSLGEESEWFLASHYSSPPGAPLRGSYTQVTLWVPGLYGAEPFPILYLQLLPGDCRENDYIKIGQDERYAVGELKERVIARQDGLALYELSPFILEEDLEERVKNSIARFNDDVARQVEEGRWLADRPIPPPLRYEDYAPYVAAAEEVIDNIPGFIVF